MLFKTNIYFFLLWSVGIQRHMSLIFIFDGYMMIHKFSSGFQILSYLELGTHLHF